MTAPQWHFEDFRLDLENACLWHGAAPLALPPKAFNVLHYLVTHPGRLVTKGELLDHIWPETAVTDAVVRVAIGVLRKAVADTRRPFRVIATVLRRGYRFLPPVTLVDAPAAALQEIGLVVPVVPAPEDAGTLRHCAICQQPLSHADRFCATCGAPVAAMCPTCGQVVPLPATFCPGCGQRREAVLPAESPDRWPTDIASAPQAGLPLPTPRAPTGERQRVTVPERVPLASTPTSLVEKIRTSHAALEGERKQVTVLFADIKDSLELIRRLDPEAAQQLLDPALHAMMDAVHRYAGTVNQVLGDGIMALFGAPIAHEDHAARACYAALAMQAALRDYAAEVRCTHGVALQSRIGLNAGEVVVRTIRHDLHMEYSAVGPTTHLAARLEQLASPDTILLTAATVRLVEGLVRIKAVGPVTVKGLGEPVEMWELLGASGQRWRLQTARARGLTPFVGRQTELAALHAALTQAGAGHGQVVAVLGEAGVGKSRLVDEFVQAAHAEGWLVLDSAAMSYSQTTPYFPVLDLLRRFYHLEEREDMRTIQTKVTAQVRTLDAALQDTMPALLALLDALPADSPLLQLDPPQRRQRTHTALKRVLLRASQEQPVLLVVEDLHWLDTETQAVLDSLGESVPTARLLLLVTYRPEYRHGWGSKTYYTQLRLDPLPPASAAAFLQALLGDDPSLAPLTQFLSQRTEGNPFFLEESVRTLVETQVVLGNPGAYYLAGELPRFSVPATVQAVLAARIDRLPLEEKQLLQTAAVIGTEVPLPLLQTVGKLSEEILHLSLTHLQDTEFLYEASLFPELVYTFKHALTQEVAYGSLLHERRRVLHARIVEALEALAGDRVAEQVDRLAHHALRGEVWDKAVTYYQQAGARAYDRAAFREAVAAFEQALQALAHLPEHSDTRVRAIELRLALDSPLNALGEHGRRLALLGEAEALVRTLDDRARLGWVLAEMARALTITGNLDGAMAVGQQAREFAAELGDSALQVEVSHILGRLYWTIGDFGRAAELLRWSVEAADQASDKLSTNVRIESQAWLARTLSALGAFAEGRRHGEEALRFATLEGRGQIPIIAHSCLGHLYFAQGDLEHAIRILEQGLALCRASSNRTWLRVIMADLGYTYALNGRLAEGYTLLEEAISESIRTGALSGQAYRVAWLSEAYRLAGHGEEAGQHARQALDLAWQQKTRGDEALALHQLGVAYAHADPPDTAQAEAHYQQALALAEALGMRPLVAHCHLGLGTLYNQMGRAQQARTALGTAIELYRTMEMTFWLPQAEAALAQVA
jgi:class 3 adenylate cyclase/DNA-binding winged helix-turn-helix (wHTH) protein/tetratricopeptide (TPR) repeat protein/ABC-type thiamine transport system ATPase subunit